MKKCLTLCLCLTALLCLIFLTTPKAQAATYGNLTYTVSYGEATITDCNTSATGALTIPSTLGGYPVTTIGNFAFSGCTSLTSVAIGDSVTSIGNYAFSRCTSMTSVTIGDSVTTIGEGAFNNCTSLTDVYITDPNAWCKISFGNTDADPLNYADNGHILDADGKELTELVLDTSVTSIPAYAFRNCKSLTSITIRNSVTSIGNSAFEDCTSLADVYITDPNAWCKISFGNDYANPLYYADNGHILDADGKELTELMLGTSVTLIPDHAFRNCKSLTSITIRNSVTSIGNSAFRSCTSLTSVTIPNSVTTIGDYAFYYCTSLTSITIRNSVTTIGFAAFFRCTSLTSITIPDSVTTIGGAAFRFCTSLTSVTIPDSVTTIDSAAFRDCTSLTGITIPDSVTTIGGYVFNNCTGLTSVTIGDSVTTIGGDAFSGCTSLTDITIPDSVTSIRDSAFNNCNKLKNVYYSGTEAQWTNISIGSSNSPLNNATKHYSHIHDYTLFPAETIAPTCTTGGYTIYTCVYGETIEGDSVPTLGHDYTGPEKTVEATCILDGHTGASCTRCDDIRVDTVIPKLGHSFTSYISNGDATYFADGTKTAKCDRCEVTDTVTDEGSRLIPEGNMILLQPENVATDSGAGVTFSVLAYGEIASYQWQYRKLYKWFDTTMTGYNTDTLTVAATGARNGYDYRCVITFTDGTVLYSEPAELLVSTTLTVTKSPANQIAVLGYNGRFTVAAEGESVKYQWQYCRPGSDLWIDTSMEGATKATLFVETSTDREGYLYRCKFTDVTGKTAISEPAKLQVLSITANPTDRFTAPGETVTFTVSTSLSEGFTYQWQYSKTGTSWINTSMTGYNTDTLTVDATLKRNGYQYRCVLTGTNNNKLESGAAALYVGDPVVIKKQPQDLTVIDTEKAVIYVVASNAYAYRWQYTADGSVWLDATASGWNTDTLTVPASGKNGYQYRCIITGLNGETYTSKAATLTVVDAPFLEVLASPDDRSVPADRVVKFATVVDGDVTGYCWQYTLDGQTWLDAPGEGADTSILMVIATADLNGAQFRCVVTGQYGMQVITQSATLTVQ